MGLRRVLFPLGAGPAEGIPVRVPAAAPPPGGGDPPTPAVAQAARWVCDRWGGSAPAPARGEPAAPAGRAGPIGVAGASGGRYVFNLKDGVDWGRYLRVVDPCTTRGTC